MAGTNSQPRSEEELNQAKLVLETEARCILDAKERLDHSFLKALDLIYASQKKGGKVVTMGVGKSGKVADKVAATLSSTGTLAIYLHPTEAAHGDLGMVTSNDALLLFSNSGSTDEIMLLLPNLRRLGVCIIAVVGQTRSPLAAQSDAVLNAEISHEACPMNLAPTSSTTVAIAIGDALALCLSRRWNFKEDQFALIHPAGALGRRLTLLVSDLMKKGDNLAWVNADCGMDDVVSAATEKPLGGVLVSQDGEFVGLITEGDIRRALKHRENFFSLQAKDIMTRSPTFVTPHEKASRALELMENRPSPISILPVLEQTTLGHRCVGVIRLHDLIGQL